MKLLTFFQFINESADDSIVNAEMYASNPMLVNVLKNCQENKYSSVQMITSSGAESYVCVSLMDGNVVSKVFKTDDPKVALVAMIFYVLRKNVTAKRISRFLRSRESNLEFSVFAGNRELTDEEISKRYNFVMPTDPSKVMYTNSPVHKLF